MNRRLTKLLLVVLMTLVALDRGTRLRAADDGQKPPAQPPQLEQGVKPAEQDAKSAPAAPPARPRRAFEQEPYDLITLDKENKNAVLKVVPLDLPERRLPDKVKRVGKFKVKLMENREDDYEVAWKAVESIEFFEERVLREAEDIVRRTAGLSQPDQLGEALQQFDDAYDYYQFLLRYYPGTARLQESLQAYLYTNAGVLFKKQRAAEALAILEELYRQNKDYQHLGGPQTVRLAMDRVGDQAIKSYVDAGNFLGARLLLERLAKDYGDAYAPVPACREQLNALAKAKLDEASAHLAARRFREAHEASREMFKIWPRVVGGRELVLEIARQYPLLVVGVMQPAVEFDLERLDNWAAQRTGTLVRPTVLRYLDRGQEGGQYGSTYLNVLVSDDRKQLTIELTDKSTGHVGGQELARALLAMADPANSAYRPGWGRLMSGIRAAEAARVVIDLRQPHLLPQALLQFRLPGEAESVGAYRVAARTDQEVRFEPASSAAAGAELKPVVVERLLPDPVQALDALRKGKVDMLDRILPADALRLQQDPALVVGRYAFPSIHVLVPNTANPFLANRTFRRALTYGINRDVILNKGLLDGRPLEGCRILSAALPAGLTENDPASYAYNERILPLAYDPVMSIILMKLTEQQLIKSANERKEAAPELKELVLAHPASELARFVCQKIQAQWDVVGVKCRLRELPLGQVQDPKREYDLLYLEFTMREPVVDASRIFAPGGLLPIADPYVSLVLRHVDNAENWKAARERLQELHLLLFEDMPVLPLWQMADHFVYHRGVQGVRPRPVFLYENVEQLRVIPPMPSD